MKNLQNGKYRLQSAGARATLNPSPLKPAPVSMSGQGRLACFLKPFSLP
jgi:hypothetical protein